MKDFWDQLSLCTYCTGDSMVREVLDDWVRFLGGRPNEIIFAVSSMGEVPAIYHQLHEEGKIDRLILLDRESRPVADLNAEAVHQAVEAASNEWVLVVKLDTLPYRSGHEGWLADAMRIVEEDHLLGMSGCFPIDEVRPSRPGYLLTQQYSENFAITRKDDWLAAVHALVGDSGHRGEIARDQRFLAEGRRFINEYSLDQMMKRNNRWTLVKEQSPDWSIFHVNVWGERLREVRDSYLARRNIHRCLNLGKRAGRDFLHLWEIYYGIDPPPLFVRVKIAVGHWRRHLIAQLGKSFLLK